MLAAGAEAEGKAQLIGRLPVAVQAQRLAVDEIALAVIAAFIDALVLAVGVRQPQPAALIADTGPGIGVMAVPGLQLAAIAGAIGASGDDIDHTGRGVRAEIDRLRPAQHLDPLDIGGIETRQPVFIRTARRRDPIDEDHRVIALAAADADLGEAAAGSIHRHARNGPQRVLDRGDAALFDLFGGDHAEGAAIAGLLNRRQPAREPDRPEADARIARLLGKGGGERNSRQHEAEGQRGKRRGSHGSSPFRAHAGPV